MTGAGDHGLEILGAGSLVTIHVSVGDEGEAVVLVPLTIHSLQVETRLAALRLLGADQRIDLIFGHLEHPAPNGVPALLGERGHGPIARGDEVEPGLGVVGREQKARAGGGLFDLVRVK